MFSPTTSEIKKYFVNFPTIEEHDQKIETEEKVDAMDSDPLGVELYLSLLTDASLMFDDGDREAAIETLVELIKEHPCFPDAYIRLGLIYADNEPDIAITYFNAAIEMSSYEIDARIARVRCFEKINKAMPEEPPYSKSQILSELSQIASIKKEMTLFVAGHHARLSKCLHPLHLPDLQLTRETDKKQFTNTKLSHDAVLDTFYGLHVSLTNDITPSYYFNKALLKFEHDCIAMAKLAYYMYIGGNTKAALASLDHCIETYNFSEAYYYRASINFPAGKIEEAVFDVIAFLKLVSNSERMTLHAKASDFFEFMKQFIPELKLGHIICADRAEEQFKAGKYELARANFSLAIWQSPPEFLGDYYYKRSTCNLMLGKCIESQSDLEDAEGEYARKFNFLDTVAQVASALEIKAKKIKFVELCLQQSYKYCEKDLAKENEIITLGLRAKGSAELKYRYALNLIKQKCYDRPIMGFLHNAMEETALDNTIYVRRLHIKIKEEIHRYVDILNAVKREDEGNFKRKNKVTESPASPQEQKITIEQKRKKTKTKPIKKTLINLPSPRKSVTTSTQTIKAVLSNEGEMVKQIIREQAEREKLESVKEQQRKEEERLKREAEKKERLRERKELLRRDRKQKKIIEAEEAKPEFTEDHESEVSQYSSMLNLPEHYLLPQTTVEENIILDLGETEKKVFSLLDVFQPGTKNLYRTYLAGGSVYDMVCEKLLNAPPAAVQDFDFVTEVPGETLEALGCIPVPAMKGLYSLAVNNMRIDIFHYADLKNLIREASRRDFIALYCDKNGLLKDPTGFGVINLKNRKLKSVLPPSIAFKADPLRILRAVYLSTKRCLDMSSLTSHILTDKKLLIPVLDPTKPINPFHPHRFNSYISKTFSHHKATINYKLMEKLGILETLFPEIYPSMKADREWLIQQMQETDKFKYASLKVIYAHFITCAIMNKKLTSAEVFAKPILLFTDFYKDEAMLDSFLYKSMASWSNFNNERLLIAKLEASNSERPVCRP